MKILVIRFSSIGDILLTSPALRYLKKRYPESRIDYLTRSEFAHLVRENPAVHNVIPFQAKEGWEGVLNIRRKIRQKNYDLIVDLHASLRSRLLTLFALIPVKRVQKNIFRRSLLVRFKINLYGKGWSGKREPLHGVVERYLIASGHPATGSFTDEDLRLDFFIPKKELAAGNQIGTKLRRSGFGIVMAPGARHFTKRWPTEYFAELITLFNKNYGLKTVLVGGPEEMETIETIRNICDRNRSITESMAGRISLLETAAVLSNASLFVSNDSGLMHLASAFRIPQIAFFGSSVREFGFFPINPLARVLETELPCRPCSHIGRESCPKLHFNCMKRLTPDMALKAAAPFLKTRGDLAPKRR
jgi:heptosyltransferase-2